MGWGVMRAHISLVHGNTDDLSVLNVAACDQVDERNINIVRGYIH
jgi:hypothetical protein